MKISSISNNIYKSKNSDNKSKPNFQALVQVEDFFGEAKKLQWTAKKLAPLFEKFDDNLNISITSHRKDFGFFGIFQKAILGLKFDIKYIDRKKALKDIIDLDFKDQLLKESTLKRLKNPNGQDDITMIGQLDFPVKIGMYHYPQKQSWNQYTDSLTELVKQEIHKMPQTLLEQKFLTNYNPKKQIYTMDGGIDFVYKYKGMEY